MEYFFPYKKHLGVPLPGEKGIDSREMIIAKLPSIVSRYLWRCLWIKDISPLLKVNISARLRGSVIGQTQRI